MKFPQLPQPITHDFGADVSQKIVSFLQTEYDFDVFDDPLDMFDSENDLDKVAQNIAGRLTGAVTPLQFIQAWYMLRPHARALVEWRYIKMFMKLVDAPKAFIKRVSWYELVAASNAYLDDALNNLPRTGRDWMRAMLYPRFGNEISWVSIAIYTTLALALVGAALSTVVDKPTVESFIFGAGKVIAIVLFFAMMLDVVLFLFTSFVNIAVTFVSSIYGALHPYTGKPLAVLITGGVFAFAPFAASFYSLMAVLFLGIMVVAVVAIVHGYRKVRHANPA